MTDAAIAACAPGQVRSWVDGIGAITASPRRSELLGKRVSKVGRATGLTSGIVTASRRHCTGRISLPARFRPDAGVVRQPDRGGDRLRLRRFPARWSTTRAGRRGCCLGRRGKAIPGSTRSTRVRGTRYHAARRGRWANAGDGELMAKLRRRLAEPGGSGRRSTPCGSRPTAPRQSSGCCVPTSLVWDVRDPSCTCSEVGKEAAAGGDDPMPGGFLRRPRRSADRCFGGDGGHLLPGRGDGARRDGAGSHRGGLNSVLRWHCLTAARDVGFRSVMRVWPIQGAPRMRTMEAMGYRRWQPARVWDPESRAEITTDPGLPAPGRFRRSPRLSAAAIAAERVAACPWQGPTLALRLSGKVVAHEPCRSTRCRRAAVPVADALRRSMPPMAGRAAEVLVLGAGMAGLAAACGVAAARTSRQRAGRQPSHRRPRPDAPLRRRQPCRAGRDARAAARTTTRATTSMTWSDSPAR